MTRWMVGKRRRNLRYDRIDHIMHGADRERRIGSAMEIDDLTVRGLAHAHVRAPRRGGNSAASAVSAFAHLGDARR